MARFCLPTIYSSMEVSAEPSPLVTTNNCQQAGAEAIVASITA
jgi:hypothetical protein